MSDNEKMKFLNKIKDVYNYDNGYKSGLIGDESENSILLFNVPRIQNDDFEIQFKNISLDEIFDILKSLGFREKFLNLNYKFKYVVNKEQLTKLKNSNIGEIISNKISTRYKRIGENINSNLYKKFETNKIFSKIFGMNYLVFFRMFFMKNDKNVDLRIFGIDKEITLSKKTKTYYELLENFKKKEDEIYIKKVNECLNKNYLMRKKFVIY